MESSSETKSKRLAFSATISFHLLLVLFLFLTGFIAPEKTTVLPENNSGDESLAGYKLTELVGTIPQTPTTSLPKWVSDPDEKGAIIPQGTLVTKTDVVSEATDPAFENVLKKWKQQKDGKKTVVGSEGNSEDEGKAKTNGKSDDLGTGGRVYLAGRSLVEKPDAILNESEEGTVVVDIVVNEDGKVIRAVAGQRGSTTTSSLLYKRAVNAALTAKFNPSAAGVKEQRGTYTFIFTLE